MDLSLLNPQLAVKSYILIFVTLCLVWRFFSSRPRSSKAPAIGYGSIPLINRWRGTINFFKDPKGVIDEGTAKYKGGYFRFSTHTAEYTVITEKKKVAEYLAAPDEVLNFKDTVNDMLQTEWTLGYGVAHRQYHVGLVRTRFTQTISTSTPAMFAELQSCLGDLVGSPNDWTEIPLYTTVAKMVARVSNNAFSGTLFCHNEEYLGNAIAYAQSVVLSAELIRLFPVWLKPLVARITPFRKLQKQAREIMGPLVEERLNTDWEAEKEKKKPDDMIQILIDGAPPIERTMPQIVERMMTLNMASIHTTTMTMTAAIYALAAEADKYVPELRTEAEQYSINGKIDKMALSKLSKLDSFLREAGRVVPLGISKLSSIVQTVDLLTLKCKSQWSGMLGKISPFQMEWSYRKARLYAPRLTHCMKTSQGAIQRSSMVSGTAG